MKAMIERALLVRHGQTDWNVEGRWQGHYPTGLNADGYAQAQALAAMLRGRPIGTVVSSDLPRAYQTAEAIGAVVGLTPQADERWREFHLGVFQGLTREEIEERYTDEWAAFRADYWGYTVPGGESRRVLQARIVAAWTVLIEQAEGPEVVIVSHGGSIRMLLAALFEGNPALAQMHIENTSVTTVERVSEGWRLVDVASVVHL